jgi:hypothetical protein
VVVDNDSTTHADAAIIRRHDASFIDTMEVQMIIIYYLRRGRLLHGGRHGHRPCVAAIGGRRP